MLNQEVRPAAHKRLRPPRNRVMWLVSGLALAAAYLWTGVAVAVPAAQAAGVCTGWTSTIVPPQTIRVLRTSGAASGTVQIVPFRQYVYNVMGFEWSPGPTDAVRAGAIAVKQYAWYWTVVWRGKRAADGSCYDVIDTTQDQLYRPESARTAQSLIDAVDATWTISLRKGGRLFSTGYRTGSSVDCGADADGWILYQASLYRCVRAGMTLDQVLHRYLDPVEIVRPGVGDSTGDGLGDVVVVTPGGESTNVRLYAAGKVTAPATAITTAFGVPVALPLPPAQTLFRQVADVTGDRLDDLLILQRIGEGHYQVWVAASVGDGFAPPQLWWESALSNVVFAPGALVRFVVGDFTGDGRPDAGLLVASEPVAVPAPTPTAPATPSPTPAPTDAPVASAVIGDPVFAVDPRAAAGASGASQAPSPTAQPTSTPAPTATPETPAIVPGATFWVLAGTGSGLAAAVPVWSGPLELNGTTVFTGDVDNSARADLVIQMDMTKQPSPGSGLRYAVVLAGAASVSAPVTWLDLPDLAAAGAKTVIADVNRDGRADLVVDRALGSAGSQMVGLLSTGRAFTQKTLWTSTGSFRWSASRLASADVDGDGRGDIVVLYNAGAAGSRLYRFLSTGSSLTSAGSTADPTLLWAGAAPY